MRISNDFTPRNAGGIINSSLTSGTSSDESFENESETTVRVVTTQMTKSTEIVKDLIRSEIRMKFEGNILMTSRRNLVKILIRNISEKYTKTIEVISP